MANFLKSAAGKLKDAAGKLEAITGLKKATDRPIGQPEKAREEAPIGWIFDPESQMIRPETDPGGNGHASPESDSTTPLPEGGAAASDDRGAHDAGDRGENAGTAAAGDGDSTAVTSARLRSAGGGSSSGLSASSVESIGSGSTIPQHPPAGEFPPRHSPDDGDGGRRNDDHGDGTEDTRPSDPDGVGTLDSRPSDPDGVSTLDSRPSDQGGVEEIQPPVSQPPMAGGVDVGTVTEDTALSTSGLLVALSPSGGGITWSVVGPDTGRYGALDFDLATGQWTYGLDNDAAQGLRVDQTVQEIFTLRATDQSGASVDHQITITIVGTNDVPVITGTAAEAVAEDERLAASGQLDATDTDIGDAASWSLVGGDTGSLGTLTVDAATGAWTYTLDNDAAQALKAGATAQDIFTVKVTDAAGAEATQTVTVTISGTNDVPVISGTATGLVREDETFFTSGALTADDADIGDTITWSVVGSSDGRYGSFTLDDDGHWSYALDNDSAQALRANEEVQEIFTVRATDESGASVDQQVAVTLTGTNDLPAIIASSLAKGVSEDTKLTATGSLISHDRDIGDTESWSLPNGGQGSYGSLTIDPATGEWTYTLDNDAVQGLREDETRGDVFLVRVTDEAGGTAETPLTVWIAGTNDQPVISGAHAGAVSEDGTQTVSDQLTSSDPDIGDTATWSVVSDGAAHLGALTVDESGQWSYVLDNDAVQGLKAGETAQDIFTVTVTDSAGASDTQTVTITISGTNDAPVISGTATGAVAEDGTLTTSGALTVSDIDIGDTAAWSVVGSPTGSYGTFILEDDGTWAYVLDNTAAQGLKAGDTAQDIFTVKVTDAAGATAIQTITVTVNGTNDTPVIAGTATGTVAEDDTLTASGTLTVTDPDLGDSVTWAVVTGTGPYGVLAIDGSTGQWTYTLDNETAQGLNEGDTVTGVFTVRATDAAGASAAQSITITVEGTNDIPVISGTTTGAVEEDGELTASGKLTASDADVGDTATWSIVGAGDGAYGSLALGADGSWSYTLDNDTAQALKAGETADETFTIRVTDAHGATAEQTVTITVSGTNDTPVIAGTATGRAEEDVTLTASGTLTAADVDAGDTVAWSIDGPSDSAYGALAIDAETGQWTYTLDSDAAQGLKAGEVARETFTVRATDADGASDTRLISIDITGTNDTPQVAQSLNNMGSMKEASSLTFTLDDLLRGAQVTDIDRDALTVTKVTLDGSSAPGTLVDNGNGTWTFTPKENVSNVNAEINFSASDGHQSVSASATVAIQPVADPADVSITAGAVRDVINTGSANDLGRIVVPQLTTSRLTEFTLEFTVVGQSVPESTTGAGPVIVNIGSPPSDKNTLTLWDPANMKVGMSRSTGGDANIATGIDLTDGDSHRITLTWDARSNNLLVYDNGDLALTTQLPKALPSTLYMAIAEKANTPPTTANPAGGSYRTNEHFEGTIYNVAMANKAETAEQVRNAPLAEQLENNLLIDVRAQDGNIVDTTGKHTISAVGGLHDDTLTVDSSLASAPVGSTLHIDIDTHLADPQDTISHLDVSGFLTGTVVSDGTHSVTVGSPSETVDMTGWSLDTLTAQLPDGVHQSMNLTVTTTTATPPYATGRSMATACPSWR